VLHIFKVVLCGNEAKKVEEKDKILVVQKKQSKEELSDTKTVTKSQQAFCRKAVLLRASF
jgi:hypothetical protein